MLRLFLIWFGIGWLLEEQEKTDAEAEARTLAKESQKPIINIGAKQNPFGDVRCDINPECGTTFCDAHDMSQYRDKEFSVAMLSHVVEHLDDPDRAIAEAQRIADNVIILVPSPIFPQSWLMPQHKWLIFPDRKVRIRA